MRFFAVAIACLALSSVVRADESSYDEQETQELMADPSSYVSDMEFDVSGLPSSNIPQQKEYIPTSFPVPEQKMPLPTEMPIKHHSLPLQQHSLPVQQKPVKATLHQQKPHVIVLQPIVLMPKKLAAQAKPLPQHILDMEIDRAMAYRVSPQVSAVNSRSVDVTFSPILNAKMRNILLTQQDQQQPSAVKSRSKWAVHSRRLPINKQQQEFIKQQQQQQEFLPIQQQQLPVQSLPVQHLPIRSFVNYENEFTQPILTQPIHNTYYYSTSALSENPNIARFQDSQLSSGSGLSSSLFNDVNLIQPIHTATPMTLSQLDSSLPDAPITTANLVKLGVNQPQIFNKVISACNNVELSPLLCEKVSGASQMLVRSSVSGSF
jgi:hypothetical protein